jgi:hypothetical protein
MRLGVRLLTIVTSLAIATATQAQARSPVQVVVDGVRVNVTRAIADGLVLPGQPGDATQETTIVDQGRQRVLSIIGVPYGTRPGTEDALPVAHRGGAQAYRNALHDFRVRYGQFAMPAPTVDIFGQGTVGEVGLSHEDVGGVGSFGRDVLTAEWVAEAGQRIWIVRAIQYVGTGRSFDAIPQYIATLGGLGVWADSSTLGKSTTVRKDVLAAQEADAADASPTPGRDGAPTMSVPPAYSDRCNAAGYEAAAGSHAWRHFLGTSFDGVPACGPRPAVGGTEIPANLYAGAPVEVTQFASTELSLRWMYLAYGTPPFAGNGDQLYANYDPAGGGKPLSRVANAGNAAYLPRPGDVISYRTGGSGGHTSVVVAAHADSAGRGFVEVMEQNASSAGLARLPVVNGFVLSNYGGAVTGWLTATTRSR